MKRFFAFAACVSVLTLSACTASSIDTAGLDDLTAASNLALTDEASATPSTETASTEQAATEEIAAPTTLPREELSSTPNEVAGTDSATQRIAAANSAPTAAAAQTVTSEETTADQRIAAAAPVTASTQPENRNVFRGLFNRDRTPPAEVGTPVAATALAAESTEPRVIATSTARSSGSALPGVDRERAFGINQEAASPDLAPSNPRPQVQVASAAGLARLAPNGLRTQHSGVDVQCLKPALIRLLNQVESRYGQAPIITSGYRSPERNRRARGARNSLHIYCAAADIQVPGVTKWELASYLRSLPGRGGVGTYCHTRSVHIDIGPRRDWNARCRRG